MLRYAVVYCNLRGSPCEPLLYSSAFIEFLLTLVLHWPSNKTQCNAEKSLHVRMFFFGADLQPILWGPMPGKVWCRLAWSSSHCLDSLVAAAVSLFSLTRLCLEGVLLNILLVVEPRRRRTFQEQVLRGQLRTKP